MKKLLFICFMFRSFLIFETMAQDKVNKDEILFTENGRFIFRQISDFRRDQFMLDTQTGRLWKIVIDEKEIPSLDPVLYNSLEWSKNNRT